MSSMQDPKRDGKRETEHAQAAENWTHELSPPAMASRDGDGAGGGGSGGGRGGSDPGGVDLSRESFSENLKSYRTISEAELRQYQERIDSRLSRPEAPSRTPAGPTHDR
jgi:hypothetical protein